MDTVAPQANAKGVREHPPSVFPRLGDDCTHDFIPQRLKEGQRRALPWGAAIILPFVLSARVIHNSHEPPSYSDDLHLNPAQLLPAPV